MKTVLIGLLGPTLDRGYDSKRWEHWRPSVSLFLHEDLLIDRFELIYQSQFHKILNVVMQDIQSISPETEIRPHQISFDDAWDFEEVYSELHSFAREYEFNTENEDYLIHISTGTHVAQICLFLLTESRHLPGKLIQSRPFSRRTTGSEGKFSIIDLDLSRYDKLSERFFHERCESLTFLKSGIETKNKKFNQLIEQIEHVSIHSQDCILLTGPTGAGKSHLAKRIYELKQLRRQIQGEYVEVNCATLRGDAAMSALFGHKKGSFTGALQDRHGLLLKANKGLLFLDEVGEMGMDEQTMLLRAIEEKAFMPMGSDKEVSSDFQLLCGTNKDLVEEVNHGRFRQDLLARINLWSFHLPGLYERKEDIEPNIEYEIVQNTMKSGKQVRFNKEAMQLYLRFARSAEAVWTYNFRDLNASISRMVTMAPSGRITVEVVEAEIQRLKFLWNTTQHSFDEEFLNDILGEDAVDEIDQFDLFQLKHVVDICQNAKSLSEAGRVLFNVSREKRRSSNDSDRLRKYLAKFGLTWNEIQK